MRQFIDFRARIEKYFRRASIVAITLLMFVLSSTSAVLGAIVIRAFYGDDSPPILMMSNLAIAFLLFGFTGIVQIARREAPGLSPQYPVKGILAVLSGLFYLLCFWGGALLTMSLAIQEYKELIK